MVTRRSPPAVPESPVLTPDLKRNRIARLGQCITALQLFDPETIRQRHDVNVEALETQIEGALVAAFGKGSVNYNLYRLAASLDTASYTMSTSWDGGSNQRLNAEHVRASRISVASNRERALSLLHQAVQEIQYSLDEEVAALSAPSSSTKRARSSTKVFIVHGHDGGSKADVARYLEKLGLEPVILDEQVDQGLTIMEKFVRHAAEASFAVVLLTPDDIGGVAAGAAQKARARQNVLFELGYFTGKLGRDKTCLLHRGDLEIPSDLYGVIYKSLDDPEWKWKLAKELKAAGLAVDLNSLI